jgi:hypothetical protein
MIYIGKNGKLVSGIWNLSSNSAIIVNTPGTVNDGNWHYAAMTLATTVQSLYLDGNLVGQNTSLGENPYPAYIRMGSYKLSGGWPLGGDGFYQGSLDEVRFSNVARSSTWIATEFNNQNSPSTFASVGGAQKGYDLALCIPPKLTVTKIVVNTNGGTKQVSDFPLFVDGNQVTSGAQNGFSAGPHTVSETSSPGYSGTISGDCASDGSITLNPGDVKSCTITNTYILPPPTTPAPFSCPAGTNEYSLTTADGTVVGCVAVSNDVNNLYVAFTSSPSDPIATADLDWGFSPTQLVFTDSHTFATGELSYTFTEDISLISDVPTLVLSAHATTASGKDAWVVSNGAQYFEYDLQ